MLHTTVQVRLSSEDWHALAERARPECGFLSDPWIQAWAQAYLPSQHWQEPLRYFVTKDSDGIICSALPVAVQSVYRLKMLSLAGYYSPFRGFLLDETRAEAACDGLADALMAQRERYALRLGPVSDDHSSIYWLTQSLLKRGWKIVERDLGAQYLVKLPRTVDEFQKTLGKKLRKNLRYFSNKMMRDGTLEIKTYRDLDGASWERVLDELERIERHSWLVKEEEGKPRFVDAASRTFWRSLMNSPSKESSIAVWILYFNATPVCFVLAIDAGKQRYAIAGQYDDAFEAYGPGSILDHVMYQDAIERGLTIVNLSEGDPHYKARWGAYAGPHLREIVAFPPGLVGETLFRLWEAKSTWDHIRNAYNARARRKTSDQSENSDETNHDS